MSKNKGLVDPMTQYQPPQIGKPYVPPAALEATALAQQRHEASQDHSSQPQGVTVDSVLDSIYERPSVNPDIANIGSMSHA